MDTYQGTYEEVRRQLRKDTLYHVKYERYEQAQDLLDILITLTDKYSNQTKPLRIINNNKRYIIDTQE